MSDVTLFQFHPTGRAIEIPRDAVSIERPDSVTFEEEFSRDVREIGHWVTGDLEVAIRTAADLLKAQSLISRSDKGS